MLPRPNRKRKLFSTGEIAAMVDTSTKVVARWIDEGVLRGVVLPGTKERKAHRDDLRRFFVEMEYHWAVAELDAIDGPDEEGGGDDRATDAPARTHPAAAARRLRRA